MLEWKLTHFTVENHISKNYTHVSIILLWISATTCSKNYTHITIILLLISAIVLIQLSVSGVVLAQEVGEGEGFIECSNDSKLLNRQTDERTGKVTCRGGCLTENVGKQHCFKYELHLQCRIYSREALLQSNITILHNS